MSGKNTISAKKSTTKSFHILGIVTFSLLTLCFFIEFLRGHFYIFNPEFMFHFIGSIFFVVAFASGYKAIMIPGAVLLLVSESWSYIIMAGMFFRDFHSAIYVIIYLIAPVLLLVATLHEKTRRLCGFIAAGFWAFYTVRFLFMVVKYSGEYGFRWIEFFDFLLLMGGSFSIAKADFVKKHSKPVKPKQQADSATIIEQIERLKSLLDRDIITKDEFDAEKQKLMSEFKQ